MPDHTVKDTRPETLRHFLLTRRQQVQKEIDVLLAQHRDNHSNFRESAVLDIEDMSLRDSTGAQQIALLESRTRQRNLLDEALRRLDEGTYGIC
jgi:DnaK suppressor protein